MDRAQTGAQVTFTHFRFLFAENISGEARHDKTYKYSGGLGTLRDISLSQRKAKFCCPEKVKSLNYTKGIVTANPPN